MYFVSNWMRRTFKRVNLYINSTMDFHNRQVLWFRVYIQRGKKWNGNIDKKFERIEIVLFFFSPFSFRYIMHYCVLCQYLILKTILQNIEKLNHVWSCKKVQPMVQCYWESTHNDIICFDLSVILLLLGSCMTVAAGP